MVIYKPVGRIPRINSRNIVIRLNFSTGAVRDFRNSKTGGVQASKLQEQNLSQDLTQQNSFSSADSCGAVGPGILRMRSVDSCSLFKPDTATDWRKTININFSYNVLPAGGRFCFPSVGLPFRPSRGFRKSVLVKGYETYSSDISVALG